MPNYDINPNLAGKLPAEGIAHLKQLLSLDQVTNTTAAAVNAATQTALNLKADLASPNFSGVPTLAGAPLATQAFATAAASNSSVNKYAVHSAFGEGLIDMVAAKSGKGTSGANIFYFSTNKTSDVEVSVICSTGRVRTILADGTLGVQYGDGITGGNGMGGETAIFHPGGAYTSPRAAGIMSVSSGGDTPSGTIAEISCISGSLTSISLAGLTSLDTLQVISSGLSSVDLSTLTALDKLVLSSNKLSSVDLSNNPLLTTVALDANNLSTSAIDQILADLDAHGLSNGTVALHSGGNTAPTYVSSTTLPGSSFSGVGTTCTVAHPSHGYSTGDALRISGITTLTNANKSSGVIITKIDDNSYSYNITSQTATGSGTATILKHGTAAKNLITRGWLVQVDAT
jgi:hypothetical protein